MIQSTLIGPCFCLLVKEARQLESTVRMQNELALKSRKSGQMTTLSPARPVSGPKLRVRHAQSLGMLIPFDSVRASRLGTEFDLIRNEQTRAVARPPHSSCTSISSNRRPDQPTSRPDCPIWKGIRALPAFRSEVHDGEKTPCGSGQGFPRVFAARTSPGVGGLMAPAVAGELRPVSFAG